MKFNREMFLKNDFRIVVSTFVGISFLFIIVAMILGLDFNGTVNTIQRIMFLSAVYAMVVLALNLQWGVCRNIQYWCCRIHAKWRVHNGNNNRRS